MLATRLRVLRVSAFAVLFAAGCGSSSSSTSDAGTGDGAPRDATTKDMGRKDTGAGRDTGARDSGRPDVGAKDSGEPETGTNDGGAHEAGKPEGGAREGGKREGGKREAGEKEAGAKDGGHRDAEKEAGRKDTGPARDTGAKDTGIEDAGAKDANDAHATDARDAGPPTYPFDVLTQRGNNARTGIYASETALTRSNVNSSSFGKLFTVSVDGDVYAQPLYVSSYVAGGRTRNLLIAATQHNSVFAFDADKGGAPLWHDDLGQSIFHNLIPTNDIQNEIGITSTPVIDRDKGLIYVVNKDLTGDAAPVMTHRMHVLDLATGAEQAGSPFVLVPSVPGTADDAATLGFNTRTQQARPGLTLLDGLVYVAWGSHSDLSPYHGFLVAYEYDAAGGTLEQKYGWSTTPDGHQGAIWQSGQGPMVDSENNLYVMVGNGTSTVQEGGASYSEAFVKLSPDLKVKDWFLDSNYADLTALDLDVGSGGPVMIPGTNLIVGAGKQGEMYVVNSANMGHATPAIDVNSQIVQMFGVARVFFGSPLVWNGEGTTRVYIWGPEDPLFAYTFTDAGVFNTTPLSSGDAATTPITSGLSDSLASLALSTNGDTPGTGILWANKPDGNIGHYHAPGALYALDPLTLKVLWNSGDAFPDGGTTPLGTCAKFVTPTVANGKVYLPGSSSTTTSKDARTDPGVEIAVFGLLPDAG